MNLFYGILCLIVDFFWIKYILRNRIPFERDLGGANLEGWTAAIIILMMGIGLIYRFFVE